MRLLQCNSSGEICLTTNFIGNDIPKYAILSHTWGAEEVTFQDLVGNVGKTKLGYNKIRFCADQAWRDGLQYFWVDTCCIDKSSSTELQEAIGSMFRWYRIATKCYVYLTDVSSRDGNGKASKPTWQSAFRKSRWFTRGWTLQELVAPTSVDFFSKEGMHLGNRTILEKHINDVTQIPIEALRGRPVSDFSVGERMKWIQKRETTREEDMAYSLQGIFDARIPLDYGEGRQRAFKRLWDEVKKLSEDAQLISDPQTRRCLNDLRITDPRHDKKRIEEIKGGLLPESYRWVLDNAEFQRWRHDEQSGLLWVKGDPGKGKTMLLCGIINELKKSIGSIDLISFFFCQATDLRLNSATAVLRGLIYLLAAQQPYLLSHVRKKYDHAGNQLFQDANTWVAVSEILHNILEDPDLQSTYLIVDALDECEKDLTLLLDFILQNSKQRRVKWIVSSRNIPDIEQRLRPDNSQGRLSLEMRETAEKVSLAVDTYIDHYVSKLPNLQDDENAKARIQHTMRRKANGTFLWASLVVEELRDAESWEMEEIVDEMPSGLKEMYDRMLWKIQQLPRGRPELCRLVLSTATAAYRPLLLEELGVLSRLPKNVADKPESVTKIVGLCGSFLTIRERGIYIIHQSAKEFLLNIAFGSFFPYNIGHVHYQMFSVSLDTLSQILRRDIYRLRHPGVPIDQVKQPKPDPLAKARYSCTYWVDHLYDCDPIRNAINELQDGGSVDKFLRQSYLFWLEALSLIKSVSEGILSMAKLDYLLQVRTLYPYVKL
jgi:hypothetical protein